MLSKVWVFAETDESGAITGLTKELLTLARGLGDTVEAFYAGDGAVIADAVGAYGATAVHATGDLGDQLVGAPAGAALAGAAVGVGAGRDAQVVGELRHRHALVGLKTVAAPPLAEIAAFAADDLDSREVGLPDIEARGENQGVNGRFHAVGGDDCARQNAFDTRGVQVHMRLGEGLVVVVGVCRAFAAEVVVGSQLPTQLLVPDRGEALCG